MLRGSNGAFPRTLEQELADDATLFSELIGIVFRPKNDPTEAGEPSEEEKARATLAYQLVSNWRTPPGSRRDGTFDGETLSRWLELVKELCAKTDRLEVALSLAGQVLIFAPGDPDGLWLHHAAAKELNKKDSIELRDGFRIGLFNSRGTYWSSKGKAERTLAAKYQKHAEDLDLGGYDRLAAAIRQLSKSYRARSGARRKGGGRVACRNRVEVRIFRTSPVFQPNAVRRACGWTPS